MNNLIIVIIFLLILITFFVLYYLILQQKQPIKEKFNITNNIYPIIKDATGNAINPIIWYKFDNPTTFLTDSSGTNNLVNNNAVYDSSTKVNGVGSLLVDRNKYVSMGSAFDVAGIQRANGISLSFWVKIRSKSTHWGSLMQFNQGQGWYADGYAGIGFWENTNFIGPWINNGNQNYNIIRNSQFNVADGNWHHICWTISNSGAWTFYINGVNQNIQMTASFSQSGNYNAYKNIGWAHTANLYYVNANYDDYRYYNRVLTQDQVNYLYNGPTQQEIDAENARVRAEGRKNAILNSIRENADAYNTELTSQTNSLEITSELQKYPSGILDPSSISSTPQRLNRGVRFGSEEYEIAFTSYDDHNRNNTPINLFNGNIDNSAIIDSDNPNSDSIGGSFASDRDSGYDLTSGNYIGQKSLTINGTELRGEGIYIKAPSAFIIRKYGFVALTGNENYAPGKWMLFGTNSTIDPTANNIQATLIDDATGSQLSRVNYLNKYSWYLKTIPAPTPPTGFTTYIFIFTATARSDLNISEYDYNKLNFSEITIYGHPPATTTS